MTQNNPYELLYMSRLNDRYAFEALFTQSMKILYNIIAEDVDPYMTLAPHRDDIMQEASIVIVSAIDSYRDDQTSGFYNFYQLLARRKVWNICKHYTRKVMKPGNMISLDEAVLEDESRYDAIAQSDPMNDPVYVMNYHAAEERLDELVSQMKKTEYEAYSAWLEDEPYKEGAEKRGLTYKAWDGRRLRVRKKVRKAVLDD